MVRAHLSKNCMPLQQKSRHRKVFSRNEKARLLFWEERLRKKQVTGQIVVCRRAEWNPSGCSTCGPLTGDMKGLTLHRRRRYF